MSSARKCLLNSLNHDKVKKQEDDFSDISIIQAYVDDRLRLEGWNKHDTFRLPE